MLRNLIAGDYNSVEIYKISEKVKRGAVLKKDYSSDSASKADNAETDFYLVDFDYQPTGEQSQSLVSDYVEKADTIEKNTLGLLIKPRIGDTWASDQVDTTRLSKGDYLVPKAGKLLKASTGEQSKCVYTGEYNDAGHILQSFNVVEIKTIA